MTDLENVADVYPPTPLQLGILFDAIGDPGTGAYITTVEIDLGGSFDPDRFAAAWAVLTERHDALRTCFVWDGLDEPLAVVRQEATAPIQHGGTPSDAAFDLIVAPLVRHTLTEDRWVLQVHHIVLDGWSIQVLLAEFFALYRDGAADLPAPPHPRMLLAEREADPLETWRERLDGVVPLALDGPSGPPGFVQQTIDLDPTTTARLTEVGRNAGVTLSTLVVAAWSLVLGQWAHREEVVFGFTLHGRPAHLDGADRAVGLFINTLPLRIRLASDDLDAWLGQVQKASLAVQDTPGSSLAAIQRAVGTGPLFETLFVFESYPEADALEADDVRVVDRRILEHSTYPLAVLPVPGEALTVHLIHDRARFDEPFVAALGARLLDALRALADGAFPDHDLPHERGPADTDHALVPRRIAAHADADGTAIVATDGQDTLTRAELEIAASAVAESLVRSGVTPGQLVAVHADRSLEMLIALRGVHKAGAAYVPLDPAYPAAHLRRVVAQGDVTVAVCTRPLPGGLVATSVPVDRTARPSDGWTDRTPGPDDLAYVLYTSGSSGEPKGVAITHANLAWSTGVRDAVYGGPVGTFLLVSSFAFDSSVAGLFWTLASGGRLVLPAPDLEKDLDALLELAERTRVTHLLALPTLYGLLCEASSGQLRSLRTVMVAGEAATPSVQQLHAASVPDARLFNEYGPTETTVWCTVHPLVGEPGPVPIGRPLPGVRTMVLDAVGRRCPVGVEGELWIGGPGVAAGYLGRPALTADRFVTRAIGDEEVRLYRTGDRVSWSSEHTLLFHGRIDAQLKIRGHRVETAAVEAALEALEGVSVAAVAPHTAGPRAQLYAWVEGGGPDTRDRLATTVPAFMVPDRVFVVDELPRLPNGKLDRRALVVPVDTTPTTDDDAPVTPTELLLADLWMDLLYLDTIRRDDDFFALGGDSIMSIQLVSRARRSGVLLEVAWVARHPTLEGLAAAADAAVDRVAGPTRTEGTPSPLSPIQRWFMEEAHTDAHHWNQARAILVPAELLPGLDRALETLVDAHPQLRATLQRQPDDTWVQTTPPRNGPVLQHDAGPLDDDRMRTLQASLSFDGPLFRAVLFTDGPLVLIAHHLVVDVVSWGILLDDLEALLTGHPLPPPSEAYATWVDSLEASEPPLATWTTPFPTTTLPFQDRPVGTEGQTSAITLHLDERRTDALLTTANEAYQTRPDDLLLAGLCLALDQREGLPVALERHGREGELDLSRTVGWFTSSFPTVLRAAGCEPEDAVKAVKEHLRTIPRQGIDYGIHRYLEAAPDLVDAYAAPLSFTYLGRHRQRPGSLGAGPSLSTTARSERNARLHPVDVVAQVDGDHLALTWLYNGTVGLDEVVRASAQATLDAIAAVIDTLVATEGGFTPSDFPDVDLGQGELDAFLDGLS